MKTISNWLSAARRFFRSRAFAVGILAVLLSVTVYAASDDSRTVKVYDTASLEEEAVELQTDQNDCYEILKENGIDLAEDDQVEYLDRDGMVTHIYITRALDVTVLADGKTHTLRMEPGRVADALEQAGVELGPDDLISLDPEQILNDGDEIEVNRVEYRQVELEEEIEYERDERLTPLLREGRTEVIREGEPGTLIRTVSQRLVDGEIEEEEVLEEEVLEEPVTELLLVGSSEATVSDEDFGYSIVDNAPTDYVDVIENVRAAGYSARPGIKGASGNRLYYGHVAVNPNVIPYDSKLYITSTDGRFVYGYATASDTGVAVMNGVIGVDLFYETYRESQLNGIKHVNIYVLE